MYVSVSFFRIVFFQTQALQKVNLNSSDYLSWSQFLKELAISGSVYVKE